MEQVLRLLRYSLVFVWLATALCSVWELQGQSRDLLRAGGVVDPLVADVLLGALLWFARCLLALRPPLGGIGVPSFSCHGGGVLFDGEQAGVMGLR